jgi:CRP/FNR family transcriptional regulator
MQHLAGGYAMSQKDQQSIKPVAELIPAGCSVCGVRQYGICRALRSADLFRFANSTRRRKVAHGETITFEEDEVVDYANIVSGSVKLTKLLSDGRQQIVGLQFAPEFIGRPFAENVTVSAEAATDVELCVFPKAEFEKMLREQPDFEHQLLEQTLVNLDDARTWMVTLGRKTAQEKVASFLLLLASHIGKSKEENTGHKLFSLPLKRSDIADFLGLTIETVSRQMTKLRKTGVISIERNLEITLHDASLLKQLAGDD